MTREPRLALVTGANRGLGRAVAGELHGRGLDVLAAARDPDQARETADELNTRPGGTARAAVLDVTDPAAVARLAADHAVDVLVGNAGVLLDRDTAPLTVPLELVTRTLEVNVLGSWSVLQHVVPGMVERGWGRVVLVSSGTGSFGNGLFTGAPAYSLSKTALNALTTMVAAQTAGTGVLVNAVNPGLTRTRMMPQATQAPEDAARDVAWAATLPDDGPTGCFLRAGTTIPW